MELTSVAVEVVLRMHHHGLVPAWVDAEPCLHAWRDRVCRASKLWSSADWLLEQNAGALFFPGVTLQTLHYKALAVFSTASDRCDRFTALHTHRYARHCTASCDEPGVPTLATFGIRVLIRRALVFYVCSHRDGYDCCATTLRRLLKRHEFCPHWNAPDYVPDGRFWACSGDKDLTGLNQLYNEAARLLAVNGMNCVMDNHLRRVLLDIRVKVRLPHRVSDVRKQRSKVALV